MRRTIDPVLATLDRIDDELFATDYRRGGRHQTLLPEPPTIRLRLVVDPEAGPAEPTVRLPSRPVVTAVVGRYVRVRGAQWSSTPAGGWPTVRTGRPSRRSPVRGAPLRARVRRARVYRASLHHRQPDGSDVVVFVGVVVLIVVAVAASGLIVWWWA